jgi:hypothetical protein
MAEKDLEKAWTPLLEDKPQESSRPARKVWIWVFVNVLSTIAIVRTTPSNHLNIYSPPIHQQTNLQDPPGLRKQIPLRRPILQALPLQLRSLPLRHHRYRPLHPLPPSYLPLHARSRQHPIPPPPRRHHVRQRRRRQPLPRLLLHHMLPDRPDPAHAPDRGDKLRLLRVEDPAPRTARDYTCVLRCGNGLVL